MTFGEALEALKKGARIARRGWNGKGMYLFLAKGTDLTACIVNEDDDDPMPPIQDSIFMKTAQETTVAGWLASQTDMLAEDWYIVD